MSPRLPVSFRTLGAGDATVMRSVLSMFGEAFREVKTYSDAQPSTGYLKRLLGRDTFIALAAVQDNHVVGGVAAYVLPNPAIALYTKLGAREDVMHFDIATVPPSTASRAPESR